MDLFDFFFANGAGGLPVFFCFEWTDRQTYPMDGYFFWEWVFLWWEGKVTFGGLAGGRGDARGMDGWTVEVRTSIVACV